LKRRVVSLQGAKHKFNIAPSTPAVETGSVANSRQNFPAGSPIETATRIKIYVLEAYLMYFSRLFWTQMAFAISGPKKPPLPMALEMNFPASKSLRPAPYKQQEH
jgi:hypothetical protein